MTTRIRLGVFIALLAVILAQRALWAQAPFTPSIPRWVIGSGGGTLSAGTYRIDGTVGQANASTMLSGGPFRLTGGYRGEAPTTNGTQVWLPLIQR